MHWLELPATVFNKGSESRLPCLVHPLHGKTFSHLPLAMLAIEASLVVQTVKNLPAIQETWVQSLNQEDPLEKGVTTHYSITAWRIPWTEESGRLRSMESQRVEHDRATNTHTHTHTHIMLTVSFFLDVLYQLGQVSFYIYFSESFLK